MATKGTSESESVKGCYEKVIDQEASTLHLLRGLCALLDGLGGKELGKNVGEDTTLGDDDGAEELVELFVVSDGELKVTGDDTRLLVVTGGVTGELEDLGGQVLEDRGEVDGGTGTDTLSVVAALQKTVDTTDGDLNEYKLWYV